MGMHQVRAKTRLLFLFISFFEGCHDYSSEQKFNK